MRATSIILVIAVLAIALPACKKDKKPTPAQQRTNELSAATWVLDDVTIPVTLEGAETDGFTGFRLAITAAMAYTSLNGQPDGFEVWPLSGTLTYGGTTETPNINTLIRDDGVQISIKSFKAKDGDTPGKMQIEFEYITAHASGPNSVLNRDGTYNMKLKTE